MNKFRIFAMLSCAMMLLAGTGWAQQTTIDMELNSFSGVEVKVPIDVYVQQSDRFAVSLTGPERLLSRLDVYVDDSTLVVRSKNFFHKWSNDDGEVKVHVQMPSVLRLKASAAADLEATSPIEGWRLLVEAAGASDVKLHEVYVDVLTLRASGASDIDAHRAVEARRLDVDAKGASDIELKKLTATDIRALVRGASEIKLVGPSTANRLKAEVQGASDFIASKMPCQQAVVEVTGASSAKVHVNELLKGSSLGASSLSVYGPCKTQVKTDESSSVSRL